VGPLYLPMISATSPTLAEAMRICQLRVGLSKAAGSAPFVLGNPKGWLGTAYHEVLEKIVEVEFDREDIDAAADRLWKQAVDAQYQRSSRHPLDRRFGVPEAWPGYNMARASVLLRARELAAGFNQQAATGTATGSAELGLSLREREFTAFGGRLVGRPDVIHAREIVDYKSGTIIDFDETVQADVVKAAYVRQLRIYGFLVNETLGWWPHRGILLPLAGAGAEVTLDPADCTREATHAVVLLDAYNENLRRGGAPDEIAVPSPANCKWCPFKILCPAFWKASSSAWSGQLDGSAVEGILSAPPVTIHAGAAVALSLQVQAGTEVSRRDQIAPLNPDIQPSVRSLTAGERVRLVGLRVRPDGVLVPTQRTVLARVSDLPAVALPAG
jgi:hypothetical protein